ncbi:Gfo/Idh/MocA family oxidoreductase [Bacillus sp. H-16]|uniref:Gfo/Idh/MocA family protein n=1 Tax=Alteribacter salitolerans TaxID=2912333 RepID=UPI0019660D22|nr:Gfo/Idh/MocA family oxidoreductase [Alteribacter salitolerans]MBM7097895.1 Gfo/Idh/MocA family oxidoreductase [Alteribacter salitolerans]
MDKVRIGVIGIGMMGTVYAKMLLNREIKGAELTAVTDQQEEKRQWAKGAFGEGIDVFDSPEMLLKSERVDGVIIATPHFEHAQLAVKAFEKDLHVLCEKPAGVYTKQVRQMNEAAAKTRAVFSIMYNQRTNPVYRKVRELVTAGELGEIKRTIWIIDWYRSQSYHDMGSWRGTWAGEGGGVLLNQDPHQLDLWQWMTSLTPVRVRAFCGFGKHYNIEVEDEVTAYTEFDNGATGLFVSSTGIAPETNRFEIYADRGKLVVENNQITFYRNRIPERQFNREWRGGFGTPENWKCDIPVTGNESGHRGIIENWVEAIQYGVPLIAPGEEGINGLALSNAMHLSEWTDDWVTFPIDEELYLKNLRDRMKTSVYKRI